MFFPLTLVLKKDLESFEEAFLNFASERVDTYQRLQLYSGVKYDKFQDLLKALVSVEKLNTDNLHDPAAIVRLITERQLAKQKLLTTEILSSSNLLELTMANPKEMNLNILFTYTGINQNTRGGDGSYNSSQLTNNSKYIELYVGEDMDGFYSEFFNTHNIKCFA